MAPRRHERGSASPTTSIAAQKQQHIHAVPRRIRLGRPAAVRMLGIHAGPRVGCRCTEGGEGRAEGKRGAAHRSRRAGGKPPTARAGGRGVAAHSQSAAQHASSSRTRALAQIAAECRHVAQLFRQPNVLPQKCVHELHTSGFASAARACAYGHGGEASTCDSARPQSIGTSGPSSRACDAPPL